MRKPILTANWKMHKTANQVAEFAERFVPLVEGAGDVEVIIAAPFTLLDRLRGGLKGSPVGWAGQNVHPEESGAFTGEIAPGMLVDMGCSYTIVGHSERRALFGESDEFVARKAAALLACDIRPIVCVGETLEQRDRGRALDVVTSQLRGSLAQVPQDRAAEIVVAYEPVWAIGTGRTATPEIAQEIHCQIREQLCAQFSAAGEQIRIQYGGSVKPETVYDLMRQPDIDGALVGGASLDPESFAQIVCFKREETP